MSGIINTLGSKSGVIGVTGTNNPCFSAIRTSAFDPGSTSTFYNTYCDVEHFDSHGAYNTSNGTWTCPVTGTYQIDAVVAWSTSIAANAEFYCQLLHEAAHTLDWKMFTGGDAGESPYLSMSILYPFNAGEVLIVRGWQNSDNATKFYGDPKGSGCKFSGFRLS